MQWNIGIKINFCYKLGPQGEERVFTGSAMGELVLKQTIMISRSIIQLEFSIN